ncbi:BZIP-type transcription factor MBZ1 [Pseudocercospora fuligena]|uniref:BZIP-type transcription factor MBZ1 n=1 Tax=Pseudocercospora fuligena TaxID=685502 RepID=A0A8H6RVH7_9PEZI|nr:BZIP-type transcription factor MBZ1 [Pseudocercospora fuligena]
MSRPTPQLKTEQFDMDSFFDFNQGNTQPSPVTASSSRTDAMSPFDKEEQQQHFNGPSHDYGQFKQQVGLPVGSLANMPQNGMFDGFNSGIGDMEFNSGFGWNSGIDVDSDMAMDFSNSQPMPAMFFPPSEAPSDNFVNPNSVGGHEEPPSHVGQYIGQLEGEVAIKTQESNSLRQENQALLAENERYRGLIETLLRHPAFTPFINDISKDPSVLMPPQQQPQRQQQPSMHPTPNPQPAQPHQQQGQQDMKPDFLNFDASQLQLPQSQPEQQQQQQVNLAMIPEENFSKLNLSGYQQRSVNFNNYGVNAYAVTSLPSGPDPVDLLIESPARLPLSVAANVSISSTAADSGLSVLLAKLDNAARNTITDHLVY